MELPARTSKKLLRCSHWPLVSAFLADQLPNPCLSLLDLGCGSGELIAELGEDAANIKITGVDADPPAIHRATDEEPGHRFLQGSFEELPLLVGTTEYDCVLAILSLHHATNLFRACSEVTRHVRVGGRFVLIDLFSAQCDSFAQSVAQQLFFDHIRFLRPCLRTLHDFGWRRVLSFCVWRIGYFISTGGRAHMKDDYDRHLPPLLDRWRDALNLAMPDGEMRILMGSLLGYTWTRPSGRGGTLPDMPDESSAPIPRTSRAPENDASTNLVAINQTEKCDPSPRPSEVCGAAPGNASPTKEEPRSRLFWRLDRCVEILLAPVLVFIACMFVVVNPERDEALRALEILERFTLAVVAGFSTFNYQQTLDLLKRCRALRSAYFINILTAVNVFLFSLVIRYNRPSARLTGIVAIYAVFLVGNFFQVSRSVSSKYCADTLQGAILAFKSHKILLEDNIPTLIGYTSAVLLVVIGPRYYKIDETFLRFFAGGIAAFHLTLSVIRYSLEIHRNVIQVVLEDSKETDKVFGLINQIPRDVKWWRLAPAMCPVIALGAMEADIHHVTPESSWHWLMHLFGAGAI